MAEYLLLICGEESQFKVCCLDKSRIFSRHDNGHGARTVPATLMLMHFGSHRTFCFPTHPRLGLSVQGGFGQGVCD